MTTTDRRCRRCDFPLRCAEESICAICAQEKYLSDIREDDYDDPYAAIMERYHQHVEQF